MPALAALSSLNVHLHALMVDSVFAVETNGVAIATIAVSLVVAINFCGVPQRNPTRQAGRDFPVQMP